MNTDGDSSNNEKAFKVRASDIVAADAMTDFMKQGWVPYALSKITAHPSTAFTKIRRENLSKKYPGVRLVFPAGSLKTRSNDSDYPFRAHSAFSWFTGIIAPDAVPDSVFIMEPTTTGHKDMLFVHPRSARDNDEFYKNARYGEFWVGRRMSIEENHCKYALSVHQLETIEEFFAQKKETLIIRGEDKLVDKLVAESEEKEKEFLNFTSLMRIVKDQYEIDEMQKAVDASIRGFADMVRVFPAATSVARGERIIESAFYGRARLEGNGIGYPSIVAAGSNACVLHWTKNNGDILFGDLVLIDAGVEVETHYTADITRTFPVNGKFSKVQREIYMIVYKAQCAGIAVVKPGAKFKDFHNAVMVAIAEGVAELGVLPVSVEESLQVESELHKRWQFHGSGHHLGMDVHDCAHARKEQYAEAVLEPGMILTIEPGFYIQPDDALFPEEYRGIGVRIEDDILVTESGCKILSSALPRHPDEVEVYMAKFFTCI